jgi:hypothetical protein
MSHVWVERFGQSYFLTGQQRLDDALLYVIGFPDGGELQALLRQFDDLSFALLYRDNRGKERRHPITERRGVEQLI